MTQQQILDNVNFFANKEQSGKTFTPDDLNAVSPLLNIELWLKELGLSQEYQLDIPISKVMYEINQLNTEATRKFKVVFNDETQPLPVTPQGIMSLPSDYKYPSSITYKYSTNTANCETEIEYKAVEVLTEGQFDMRRGSKLMPPTHKNPVCCFYDSYIKFLPLNLQFINFTYLRLPKTPFYDYYIDSNDNIVYLPAGSSHLLSAGETGSMGQTVGTVNSLTVEWEYDEMFHPEIVYRLLLKLGVNMREAALTQIADKLNTQGQ